LVAKVDGHVMVNAGDMVELVVDRAKLHAFDLQTEVALTRA